MENGLHALLEQMADRLPGFEFSALVDRDTGRPLAACDRRPGSDRTAPDRAAIVVRANMSVVQSLTGGQPADDVLITAQSHNVLIRSVPATDWLLVILTRADQWVGRTRLLVKEYEKRLQKMAAVLPDAEIWVFQKEGEAAC